MNNFIFIKLLLHLFSDLLQTELGKLILSAICHRLGCSDHTVEAIQEILGVTVDNVFGDETLSALQEYLEKDKNEVD